MQRLKSNFTVKEGGGEGGGEGKGEREVKGG